MSVVPWRSCGLARHLPPSCSIDARSSASALATLRVIGLGDSPPARRQVPASQRPNKFGPHELPLIVQMLWRDKHIFSKSWARDLWVVMKNRRAHSP